MWVARLRSFTAAAEKLCATQATISARIATLESDFGVRLFDRDHRTVALTAVGEELLRHAEQVLTASQRMSEAVTQRSAGGHCVALGVIEGVVHTWLPDVLLRLRREVPDARVEIHSYTSFDLHEELLRGSLDLTLTSEVLTGDGFYNTTICHFPMAWVVASAVRRRAIESDATFLSQSPIVTFLRESFVYRDVVTKLGVEAIARINPMSSIAAMTALAGRGYAVATLPPAVVTSALSAGELIALRDVPALSPIPVIATHRRQCDALVQRIVQLAGECAAAYP